MTSLSVGLLLTVLASLALNASYLLQHVGGLTAPAVDVRRPVATLHGLLRSRLWLAGTAIGTAGSVLHAGALSQAPISLVQAFSAAGLALLAPVAARVTKTRLGRAELAGVLTIVAGLGVLAIDTASHPASTLVAGVALPLAVAGATGVVGWLGRRHTAALGLATGMLYGVADAATKAGAALLHRGVVPTLLSPWPPMFVISCAAAFFLFQRGLQRGPAMTVVAVMSGALNVTAVAAGLAMFGETLGTTTAVACLHAVALTAVLVATWRLARAQARAATGAERQGEVRVGARGLE